VLASRPAAVSPVLLVRPLSLLWIPKLLFDVRKVCDGTHLKVKEFEHEPVFESETASSP
jgi:hypothetical protein